MSRMPSGEVTVHALRGVDLEVGITCRKLPKCFKHTYAPLREVLIYQWIDAFAY